MEAVFNRGLTLKKARPQPDRLEVRRQRDPNPNPKPNPNPHPSPNPNPNPIEVTSQGRVKKLKSFLRWCYTGPPLARADSVSVAWEEV